MDNVKIIKYAILAGFDSGSNVTPQSFTKVSFSVALGTQKLVSRELNS